MPGPERSGNSCAEWPRLEFFWGRAIQPMLTLMGTCVFGCLWAAPAVEGGAFVFDLNDGLFMLNSPCLGLALRNLDAHAPPPRTPRVDRLAKSRPQQKPAGWMELRKQEPHWRPAWHAYP